MPEDAVVVRAERHPNPNSWVRWLTEKLMTP